MNKGKIDPKDTAKVKAKSLVNLGTLHSEGTLSVTTAQLFRNAGKLDTSDLQLSAHIVDQVSLRSKEASQLKASHISITATETLNLKTGTLITAVIKGIGGAYYTVKGNHSRLADFKPVYKGNQLGDPLFL